MKVINIVKLIGIGIMATNIAHASMNQAEFEELCELAGGDTKKEQLDAFSLIEQFVKTKVIRDLLAK